MIYLASPYTDPNAEVREQRYRAACRHAAKMMSEGGHVFSPIAHSHGIAVHGKLPSDWAFWNLYDREMIGLCDKMIVLALPGWQDSSGVRAEIEIAREFRKPIGIVWPDEEEVATSADDGGPVYGPDWPGDTA